MSHKNKNRKLDMTSTVTLKPIETEKTTMRPAKSATALYAFYVPLSATKVGVANLVSSLFAVMPLKVNIVIVKGKNKRVGRFLGKRSDRKKAYVLVASDKKLDIALLTKQAESEEVKAETAVAKVKEAKVTKVSEVKAKTTVAKKPAKSKAKSK